MSNRPSLYFSVVAKLARVIGHYNFHETPQAAICKIDLTFWKYLDGQYVAYRKLTAITT